jgi:tetratricopeptide (TPR) repeat protein
MPMGKFKDATESAAGYGWAGNLNLNESFSLGLELMQIHYKQKDVDIPLLGPYSSEPGALITEYGLHAKFMKPMSFGSHNGKIYGILGIGSYSVLDAYTAYTAAGSGGVARYEASAIGLNFGGGLDVELAPQWLAGFELRYHMINKDYSILNPTLRITYAFGPAVEPRQQNPRERFPRPKRTSQYRDSESGDELRQTPKMGSIPESDDYQTCLSEARSHISRQDYKSAAQEYTKALGNLEADDNRRVYLYERLGYVAVKAKNYARAKNYYLAAVGAAKMHGVYDKHAVNAYSGLAYCFETTGNIPLAIKNYEKALELTADYAVAGRIEANLKHLRASAQDDFEQE